MNRIALAAVVLAALTLSACATGEPVPSESPAVSTTPVPVPDASASGDEVDVVDLPKSFPADDVPLLEGDLLVANELSDGWSVLISSNDVTNDFAAASELLVAVGYTNTVTNSDGDKSFASFDGEKYQVQVSAAVDETYGPAITYTIYPTQ